MVGKRTRLRALGVCVVIATLVGACGNSGSNNTTSNTTAGSSGPSTTANTDLTKHIPVHETGVTDTEIKVGSITAKTNPLGGNYGSLNDGIKAYFDFMNAKGGIYGRHLVLSSERDDQMGQNQTEAEALVSQDGVYAAFIATLLYTGAKTLAQAGIPTYGWNINGEWAGPTNFFPNNGALCFTCGGRQLPWMVRDAGRHRVAVLGYNVPQSQDCVKGDVKSFDYYGKDVGAQIVYNDSSLQFGQTDFSAQVDQLKKKKVDFVTTCMDFNGAYGLLKEVVRQGLRKQITFHHPNLYDQQFVQKANGIFEGDYVVPQFLGLEQTPHIQAQKDFFDYAKAHNSNVNELYTQGWIAAKQFVDGLKAAGPDFTRANLINAWNKQKAYSADGWLVPIDWTKQHNDPTPDTYPWKIRSPWDCFNPERVHNSQFVPDGGEPGKPWVCFDGSQPEGKWMEPIHVSFVNVPADYAAAKKLDPTSGSTTTG
jgi:branched-chain amino acid transport system substrate-binding protein